VIRFADRGTGPGVRKGDREGSPEGPVEHPSPGLRAIVEALDPESDNRVLDVGPAVPANITFFSRFATHIRIADAVEDLRSIVPDEDDPDAVVAMVEKILPVEPGEFDVVMAWDLLSYLGPEVVVSLVARLQMACRSGAKVLLLIQSGSTMPADPQVFEIRSDDRIAYRPTTSRSVAPRDVPPAEV